MKCRTYTDKNILDESYYIVSKTFPGFPALGVQNCLPPIAGNPGNVLLTSRNCQKYFYQCRFDISCGEPSSFAVKLLSPKSQSNENGVRGEIWRRYYCRDWQISRIKCYCKSHCIPTHSSRRQIWINFDGRKILFVMRNALHCDSFENIESSVAVWVKVIWKFVFIVFQILLFIFLL